MNTQERAARVRPAASGDLRAVQALLRDAGLPTDGVAEQLGSGYVVAEEEARIVAAAGVEVHGSYGLLRSVVVSPDRRGRGLGERLVQDRIRWAEARGLEGMALLTTTAAGYFPRLGFAPLSRADVPEVVRSSSEFAGVCPTSAAVLWRTIREG